MCGRAFDPLLSLAWPGAKCSVMGAAQAANTLLQVRIASDEKRGIKVSDEEKKQLLDAIKASYDEQQDIRYGAARLWVDRMIEPEKTRDELIMALQIASTFPVAPPGEFRTGVLQV
jgi:acetyl-CoA carboxylase carboxyltransferase component